jgi:RNA polymerase subunit RPABC4/transcription elongation factor Spt4
MSKAHRGKGIRELAAHGRGTCPVCGATGIKVLYEAGEQKVKVCKPCRAAVKHGKKSVPAQPVPAAAE